MQSTAPRRARRSRPRRARRMLLLLMAVLMLLLMAVLLIWRLAPGYRWRADQPLGIEDLRLNGRAAASGDLAAGDQGPRGLRLSMASEEVLKALPSGSAEDLIEGGNYTPVYGDFDGDGNPLPPCAVLTVEEGDLTLRILTGIGEDGRYGLVMGVIDPENNTLQALRWRMVSSPDILQPF